MTFEATVRTEKIQDVVPGQAYINIVNKGEYIHYRLLDTKFDLDEIYQVRLDLKTYIGDADLYVSDSDEVKRPSVSEYTYASRRKDFFDSVTITDTVHTWLSSQLYISIYGELYSEFEFTILVEYHPIWDQKLTSAEPLTEAISVYGEFKDPYGGKYYSFRPWWSMHEKKTIVMLADSPLQEVDFYLALDDYPLIYMTDWVDWNEMFSIKPTDAGYSDANGFFGTYYIRVRPKYTLADLFYDKPYSYYFRTFS